MTPTQLFVDLAAIVHNLEVCRSRGGGRAVIAAVKADAYGHGMVAVAKHLEPHVVGFGVATVPEGVALRDAGITATILKLSPANVDELPAAVDAELTLVVGSLDGVDAIADAAARAGRTVDVHLKIDTGMHRVGVAPDDARAAAVAITSRPELRLQGVMTHLAVADTEDGRDFTEQQRAEFRRAVAAVQEVCAVEWIHSGNSAGILNHDLGDDNAIRPGIALYGSAPELNLGEDGLLRHVATWTSRVTLVKPLAAGESVSYGRTWTAPQDTRVATVAVGYGDGYSRLNSSRGRVLINGRSHSVVGRVCMDQIMVDVGPDSDVTVGDEVILMGASGDERITPQEIADLMGTIPYEVTCLITPRVERRYVG